jgi:hypothetical protein
VTVRQPLSGEDALGVGATALEPGTAGGSRAGDRKEPDQHEAHGDTDSGRAADWRNGGAFSSRRLGPVLPVIGIEGLASSVDIAGGNDEGPAIEPGAQPMGNATGG